jgi:CrcB protein
MSYYLIIALGGALGAISRYWLSSVAEKYNSGLFPVGTLTVNLLGSLLIGIFFVVLLEKIQLATHLRPLIIIGFLGAFTTFSTFSIDALLLIEQGHYATAAGYLLISVTSCITAAWIGMSVTRLVV